MAALLALSCIRRANAPVNVHNSAALKAAAALEELISARPFSLEAASNASAPNVPCLPKSSGCLRSASSLLPSACIGPALRLPSRGFSAETGNGSLVDDPKKVAADVLQTTAVLDLRDHMNNISQERAIIPRQELLDLCVSSGAAATAQQARELVDALQMSGVVLGAGKWVYLRPEDVVHTIIRSIPHTEEELQNRIQEVDSHLQPLEKSREEIEKTGHSHGRMFLFAVLAGMFTQYAIIFRLVYWDLSWDVMEPVAYFCTGGTSTLCLLYYLFFRTEFNYTDLENQWKRKYIDSVSFPQSHYENLLREKNSYAALLNGVRAAAKKDP